MRSTAPAVGTLAAWLSCAGCAGPQRAVTGPSQDYTGQPYSLRQQGDTLGGQVCGQNVNYSVERQGEQIVLTGFINAQLPSRLEIREERDTRSITGSIGTSAGSAAVDLQLRPDMLRGRVGWRRFDLRRQGDLLAGELRIAGTDVLTTATVHGVSVMWAMTPEAQAAVLANLLTCFVAPIGSYGRSPLVVGFGGPPGAQPMGSSSVPVQ